MNNWEKKFDYDTGFVDDNGFLDPTVDSGAVKEFISKLINQAEQEIIAAYRKEFMKSKEKKEMPFLAVGNEEIENNPTVKKGDMIDCKKCGGKHPLKYGKDAKTGKENSLLGFINCGKKSYLVSIDNKLLK